MALVAVFGAIAAGGNVLLFVHAPAFLLVVLLTLGLLLWSHGASAFGVLPAVVRLLAGRAEADPALAAVARSGARFALMSGCVGTLIGMVSMFATLDDPSRIGGGTATAFLPLLYGVLFAEVVFTPLGIALQGGAPVSAQVPGANAARMLAGLVLLFSTAMVLMLLLGFVGVGGMG
jgi:flagellar motor component MotA